MGKKKKYKGGRIKKGLNIRFNNSNRDFFQNVSAEREDDLNDYYVDNSYFQNAISEDSKKAFFIGRTGSGKTAILERVKNNRNKKIIAINPEDFAFKIIERSPLLRQLTEHNINLDLFYKTMWKYIFITEILKQIYGSRRQSWFEEKIKKYISDKTAVRAYNFLRKNDELESGQPFNQRIATIIKKMEHSIGVSIGSVKITYTTKFNPELEEKIYAGLREFEFTDLNHFLKHLDKEVLKDHKFVILVDDLDKNWIQNDIGVNFTRCLFETIFDINNSKHLRLLVSLRTNLFMQLNLAQNEKFLPYIDYISWKDEQLKEILEERFLKIKLIQKKSDLWDFIFPKEITKDQGRKFPILKYLLDRSNMRPRDLLIFISFAIEKSLNKNEITSEAIQEAELPYSEDRLQALMDEWKNPYLNLKILFSFFNNCLYKMTKKDFFDIMETITLKILEKDESKENKGWLWVIEGDYINKETFDSTNLVKLLYKIGLIGIKESPSTKVNYSYKNNETPSISEESKFYINPCYHKALRVKFHIKAEQD